MKQHDKRNDFQRPIPLLISNQLQQMSLCDKRTHTHMMKEASKTNESMRWRTAAKGTQPQPHTSLTIIRYRFGWFGRYFWSTTSFTTSSSGSSFFPWPSSEDERYRIRDMPTRSHIYIWTTGGTKFWIRKTPNHDTTFRASTWSHCKDVWMDISCLGH